MPKQLKKANINQVMFTAVGFLRAGKPAGYDPEELLKLYQNDIDLIVEQVLAGNKDVDLLIAEIVEHMNDTMRQELVRKVQEIVQALDAEKAQLLKAILERQREAEQERKKEAVRQGWLAYFFSRETLKRLKEAFLVRPGAEREVENIGMELAKKGIFTTMQLANLSSLGELSNNVQQVPGKEKDQGRGF